jgi:hypothetical protein
MDNDTFVRRARDELAALQAEDNRLADTQRDIAHQRHVVAARISRVEAALEYYELLMRITNHPDAPALTRPSVQPRQPSLRGRRSTTTIANTCEQLLLAHGGEATVIDLVADLVDRGEVPPEEKRQVYRKLTATMVRDQRFQRRGTARFGLALPGPGHQPTDGATNDVAPPSGTLTPRAVVEHQEVAQHTA